LVPKSYLGEAVETPALRGRREKKMKTKIAVVSIATVALLMAFTVIIADDNLDYSRYGQYDEYDDQDGLDADPLDGVHSTEVMDELEELAVVIDRDWRVVWSDMYSIPPGNVGIGTTEMDAKLDVVNESDGPAIEGRSEADLSSGLKYGGKFYAMEGGSFNCGVYGRAGCYGGGCEPANVNIGVYGLCTIGTVPIMPSGDWAGYFSGDVKVTGDIVNEYFDYDSGWFTLDEGDDTTLTHRLYGDESKYIVYLDGKDSDGIHQSNFGTASFGAIEKWLGCEWHGLTSSRIKVTRARDDDDASHSWDYIRVRIRKNQG
jgi:hypothetical protein